MTIREEHRRDSILAFTLRLVILSVILSTFALLTFRCPEFWYKLSLARDSQSASITCGSGTETRNLLPHGGIDEKSDPTPTQPKD